MAGAAAAASGAGTAARHDPAWGTDINDYLVETCQRCVPFARISKNSLVAMLDYANQSFDLVYAFSVFTHFNAAVESYSPSTYYEKLK